MYLKKLILATIVSIILINSFSVVYGFDLDEYKLKAEELNSEIVELKIEKESCVKNKDLAHQLAQYARALGMEETDEVILRARAIWDFNNKKEEEINNKLFSLSNELEEYSVYSNMTYLGDFKLTGYCPCSRCCGKWANGITAMGTTAQEGRTIAMDKRYPFGTKVYIEGLGIRVVEDRGGAIKGNRIDVYCDTHSECYNSEYNKTAKVYIIND